MISYIEGTLSEKNPTLAVIDCGGIGYALNISLNTFAALGETGTKCKLFTHLAVKNEATTPVGLVLYGFISEDERTLFLHLISVNGVGMNTARLILSSLTADEAISSIVNGNYGTFKNVKGIGEKTAQKIILDLRDKFSRLPLTTELLTPAHNTKRQESLSALIMLGFARNLAEKAIDKILKQEPNLSVEELIKQSLRIL